MQFFYRNSIKFIVCFIFILLSLSVVLHYHEHKVFALDLEESPSATESVEEDVSTEFLPGTSTEIEQNEQSQTEESEEQPEQQEQQNQEEQIENDAQEYQMPEVKRTLLREFPFESVVGFSWSIYSERPLGEIYAEFSSKTGAILSGKVSSGQNANMYTVIANGFLLIRKAIF